MNFDEAHKRNILNKTVPLIEHFSRENNRNRICLDIGCSIGEYTHIYSQYFTHVHSFDPIPHIRNASCISWDNVTYHQHCIADDNLPRKFYFLDKLHSCSSLDKYKTLSMAKFYETEDNLTVLDVAARTIDSYSFKSVDFIKIDIEANVCAVLNSGIKTIKLNRPTIQVEIPSEEEDCVSDFMKANQYQEIRTNAVAYEPDTQSLDAIKLDRVFMHQTAMGALIDGHDL